MELDVALVFTTEDTGLTATIDIPQEGVNGLALNNVRYDPPSVYFAIDAAGLSADFEGTVRADTISGQFAQGGVTGSFELERIEAAADLPAPGGPVRYREKELTFRNGDITLAGTLTLPAGSGPHPAVVLITGSGPQNRDEEIFGFRIFEVIAEHLSRQGVAVFRYDDRGVGGSTGNIDQATSRDFAGDVVAAVDLLISREDINSGQIGLLGHSEGGIVAAMAALRSESVSFLILMATTGVPGHEVLQAQLELIAPTQSMSQQELEERLEVQRRSFEAARSGEGFEELEADLRRQVLRSLEDLPEEERRAITDEEEFVETRVQIALQAMQTPWFKFFLDYDPAVTLRRVTVPVLAVFGGRDLQVPPEVNRPEIEQALALAGNQDVTSVTFPRANHLFQEAGTGSPSEYPTLDKRFVPGFLELMSGWVLSRLDKPAVMP